MQQLGTERTFVEEQYSDADKLRIRTETHERYSQGDPERLLDNAVEALALGPVCASWMSDVARVVGIVG
jgi:hypothetical protein